ncbi:MAG: response regulator [Lachnospiraceae bacterium]|nr:response regulator [Lachnospiraceae bacterium]
MSTNKAGNTNGQEMQVTENKMPVIEQIAEQMPGGFFIYQADEKEEFVYVNDVTLDIFGCSTQEEFKALTGNSFKGLVHPDDLDAVESSIAQQIANNEDNLDYVEHRIIRKDGSIRWVDDYGHFVHTDDCGDLYYVFINDATKKHLTQDESKREMEVIEGLSVDFASIFLIDIDSGRMRPYRLQSEFSRDIIGDRNTGGNQVIDWKDAFPVYAKRYVLPEDREMYLGEISAGRIRERLEAEMSYTVDYRCRRKDGGICYMQMSIVRINGENLYHHAVMGYRDVTEGVLRIQKETADRLRMEEELEREKRINEAKNTFLFNISHDIRTPMNSIMGFTALAQKHIREPELLEDYLEKVDVSNRHMLALIDDLLEMSQIDSGRTQIKTEICRLDKQLHTVIDMMRPQAFEKQLSLETDIQLPDEEVYVDPLRFRRILANLLSNAIKFTPEEGQIKVSAFPKEVSKSGYARDVFVVSDSGIGMTEEFLTRIFEVFEREETSTKTGYIGTGLGLSITKRLLDIMGGSIAVESKKGEGSTFTVSLPLKLAEHANKSVDQAKEVNGAADDAKAKEKAEKRILLVEDIEINRMLAETILEEAGFLVESVPDGCDAVEAVENNPEGYYDLVLMDIQMPVMNGYEATRVIRALGREDTDRLPIIALSANARDEDKRMSMESGMNSHIAKPFDIDKLISTIEEFTNKN